MGAAAGAGTVEWLRCHAAAVAGAVEPRPDVGGEVELVEWCRQVRLDEGGTAGVADFDVSFPTLAMMPSSSSERKCLCDVRSCASRRDITGTCGTSSGGSGNSSSPLSSVPGPCTGASDGATE